MTAADELAAEEAELRRVGSQVFGGYPDEDLIEFDLSVIESEGNFNTGLAGEDRDDGSDQK